MIVVAFFAATRKSESSVLSQVDRPKLMGSSHRYDQCVLVNSYDVPRRGKLLQFTNLIPFFISAFLACPNHSQYFLERQVDFSDRMIFSVTNVDKVLLLSVNVT